MEQQLNLFDVYRERLPRRPLCTDDFEVGVYHRDLTQAIRSKYIEHNRPMLTAWIVVDVDRYGAGYDWYDLGGPPPNIVVENPKNLHAHLFYGLEAPVLKDNLNARLKPMRYAAAVEHGIVRRLEADPRYGGLLSKNPLHDGWNVRTYEPWLYDLDWLSDYVDLPQWADLRRRMPEYGLGRNCNLFDNLRLWAYRARVRIESNSYDQWHAAVLAQAAQYNNFDPPLPFAEIKATAKSVAKWVWPRFTYDGFRQRQKVRNRKSQEARQIQAAEKAQRAFAFIEENPNATVREIAEKTGIPRSSIQRYKQVTTDTYGISDMVNGTKTTSNTCDTPKSTAGILLGGADFYEDTDTLSLFDIDRPGDI